MKNLVLILLLVPTIANAQKLSLEKSKVSFFSKAAVEDIKAENAKATSIFNTATGEVVFTIPISDFKFEKSLMEKHFNEKYMESEKFPRSTFAGKLLGYDAAERGEQKVTAKGKLTIHGVTKEIEVPGTVEWSADKVVAKAIFSVKLEDYKIKIPKLLWQNIAEVVEVTLEFNYKL